MWCGGGGELVAFEVVVPHEIIVGLPLDSEVVGSIPISYHSIMTGAGVLRKSKN